MHPERVGNIRIDGVLGQGGMGTVYVGFDETLERKVALKSIRAERRMAPSMEQRFLREARVLSRLEHPNICRIHGYLEDGETRYLVLEFVEGATLSRHLEAGTLGPRHRLHVAIGVAEALVAAHARGVVHRDLKPDNVMVTREGDAKVLDFGLARAAADDDPHEDDLVEHPDDEAHPSGAAHSTWGGSGASAVLTEVGLVMGTPSYMSPEQARGGRATTASDMWSFGLLLRTLWTGRPPYDRNLPRVLVLHRASLGDVDPCDDLPRDVAALVARLLVLAPAGRATAVAALEALRRIEDRPARLLRRGAAALLLAGSLAAGVKYTVDVGRERDVAETQRGIAEARREQAEALLDFTLGDLRDKLRAVGRLDVLDDVGDQALRYFASVPESELSLGELQRRATMLYQIGEVRTEQGDLPAAMDAFAQALAVGESIVVRAPEDDGAWKQLGLAHFWMGSGCFDAGRLDEARRHFEASADVARRMAAAHPDDPAWRLELAQEESNVARVLQELGDMDGARRVLAGRLETVRELTEQVPGDAGLELELGTSHLLLGFALEQSGALDEALAHYRADLAVMRGLVSKQPDNAEWLDRLAVSLSYVGMLLQSTGDAAGAAEHLAEQGEVAARLAEGDSENASFRDRLAAGLRNYGVMEREAGRLVDARAPLERALAIHRELVALDPERPRWRHQAAQSACEAGLLGLDAGDAQAALAVAREGCAYLAEGAGEPTAPASRDVRPELNTLVELRLLEGDALAALGRHGEASAAWGQARRLVEEGGDDPSPRGQRLLAQVLVRAGRCDEARVVAGRLAVLGVDDERLAAALRGCVPTGP